MMRAAQKRGHQVWVCEQHHLHWLDARVAASAQRLSLSDNDEDWYRTHEQHTRPLADWSAVLMRKDPPFDLEYLFATNILSLVAERTLVVNEPRALRDANEKLFALRFPHLCPDTLVSRNLAELLDFRARLGGEMVIKPLDGAGGERLAVHDRGVQLIAAFRSEHRPAASVEQRIVFHQLGRSLDRVERGAALAEHRTASLYRAVHGRAVCGLLLRAEVFAFDHAGAAVYDDRPGGCGLRRNR